MKSHKLIAVLLLSLLMLPPNSPGEDVACVKPVLLVLSAPNCQPCNDFKAAHDAKDPAFRNWIQRNFRFKAEDVVDINTAKGQRLARWYNVNRVPTFLVVNALGAELHRALGFHTASQFCDEILPPNKRGLKPVQGTDKQPLQSPNQAESTQRPIDGVAVDRLKQANDSLQRKAEALDLQAREAEANLIEQREKLRQIIQEKRTDEDTVAKLREANQMLQDNADKLAQDAKQAEDDLTAQAERFRRHISEISAAREAREAVPQLEGQSHEKNLETPPERSEKATLPADVKPEKKAY